MPKPKGRRPGLQVISRKGSASLYIRGTVAGRRIFESAQTDDPKLAEERRAAREAELYRADIYGEAAEATFARAVTSYMEAAPRSRNTQVRVNRVLTHFGPKMVCRKINQVSVDSAARTLCQPDASPQTRHREVVSPISAILNHAADRGWCDAPRFKAPKASPGRTEWLTPAESEALIAGAGRETFAILLTVFLCTGARVNELVTLDWERDVDLQHGRIVIRGQRDEVGNGGTKNGADRIVDLVPRAVAALAMLPGKREGRVFRDRRGRSYRATQDSRTISYGGQIKYQFASALKASGIKRRITPHVLRHTWATHHYCIHKDAMRLMQDGGWSGLDMVQRYAKLAPNGMADEIRRFWASTGAATSGPA